MNIGYDVVVVGAGPIGITTACTIKAISRDTKICVIDKRAEPTRNHGLRINHDSVEKIQEILKMFLIDYSDRINEKHIYALTYTFAGWSDKFIRTSEIEKNLADIAKEMGITVLRGPQYGVTEENFDSLFEEDVKAGSELQQIFEGARLIIGADGSHSTVRKVVMKDKLSVDETLRYLVELKYQTNSDAPPRGFSEASSLGIKHGNLNFETMGRHAAGETKPVTLHIFVDEPSYNSLRVVDERGNQKGVFGNSWTLRELQEVSVRDAKVKKVFDELVYYKKQAAFRGGACLNEQISTLSMRIYRSESCVEKYKNKFVVLVGDSESGLVLERGFNKGLKGAAICAQAVSNFFACEEESEKMPAEFELYKREMGKIFDAERGWAKLKNRALQVAEGSLYVSHMKYAASSKAAASSKRAVESSFSFWEWIGLGGLFSSSKKAQDDDDEAL